MATTIKIKGMSCMHCVGAVKKALGTLQGVTTLDVKIGEATVEAHAAGIAAAKAAIEDAGYDVVG
ncbi:MAG: cation transporter [Mycobacterium leprae]